MRRRTAGALICILAVVCIGLVLVRAEHDGDRVTFVFEENTTGVSAPVSGTASVFVESLAVAGYDASESSPSGVTVYEPQSDWYDGRRTYRITGALGDVRVGADTHDVKSADVSWETTTPAGTYAEYVLVRLSSDDPTTHRITFEFDAATPDLERPTWAGEPESA